MPRMAPAPMTNPFAFGWIFKALLREVVKERYKNVLTTYR